MKSQVYNQVGFMVVPILALALSGCGVLFAGGSVGTDNPTVVAIAPDSNVVAGDTVHVRVWGKDQNPVSSPDPLYDTMVVVQPEGNAVAIDPKDVATPDSCWNVEVTVQPNVGSGGESAPTYSVTTPSTGAGSKGADTLNVIFTGMAPIRMAEGVDALPVPDTLQSQPGWAGDTLLFRAGVETAIPAIWFSTSAGGKNVVYLVVLGTSVIRVFSQFTPDGTIQFNLPLGVYTIGLSDQNGVLLSRWIVRIIL